MACCRMHLCPTKRCVLRGLCTDLKLILHIAFMTVWAAMHCSRSSISHPLHHCWALLGRWHSAAAILTAYLSAFNTLRSIQHSVGAWSGGGMASEKVLEKLERTGMGAVTPAIGLQALSTLAGVGCVHSKDRISFCCSVCESV